ncbi:hypothetical protein HIM_01246 [Hirsutella minnesotensis 3608]|nr:hypothetical protein HIM_01246 [Hirsutella minnesotensis 3608]
MPDAGLPVPANATSASPAEMPAAIATAHLARFEFSDHGTKVLMVEWHPAVAPGSDFDTTSAATISASGTDVASTTEPAAWQVSWPAKSSTTVVPARETDEDENGSCRRVYFLLPPEAPVPPTVTISRTGRPTLTLKPLPAIFPPGFDADVGARGVLHTLWAKTRMAELQHEIDTELRSNAESVGLQMALAEKQWILDNFLRSRVPSVAPRSPASGSRRISDRLKGLRLATSAADLATAEAKGGAVNMTHLPPHTQSARGGDVAISSFTDITRGSEKAGSPTFHSAPVRAGLREGEDDLFALPMSPRSPDMKKSPFSAL